jgi:hypothetical protein
MTPYRPLLRSVLMAASLIAVAPATLAESANDAIVELLEASLRDKKSVTLYLDGQVLAGRVVRLAGKDLVEIASREFSRILVRLDKVNGVAVN